MFIKGVCFLQLFFFSLSAFAPLPAFGGTEIHFTKKPGPQKNACHSLLKVGAFVIALGAGVYFIPTTLSFQEDQSNVNQGTQYAELPTHLEHMDRKERETILKKIASYIRLGATDPVYTISGKVLPPPTSREALRLLVQEPLTPEQEERLKKEGYKLADLDFSKELKTFCYRDQRHIEIRLALFMENLWASEEVPDIFSPRPTTAFLYRTLDYWLYDFSRVERLEKMLKEKPSLDSIPLEFGTWIRLKVSLQAIESGALKRYVIKNHRFTEQQILTEFALNEPLYFEDTDYKTELGIRTDTTQNIWLSTVYSEPTRKRVMRLDNALHKIFSDRAGSRKNPLDEAQKIVDEINSGEINSSVQP